MPTPVKTWDLGNATLVIGPYSVDSFEEGDVLIAARDEDSFTKQIGATGEASRSKTNNRGGSFTVRLKQTSPANADMSTIMLADELSNGGIVPIAFIDQGGQDQHIAPECWVKKPPDGSYGRDAGGREWAFDTGDISMYFGGN